jgi:glycosyltransferase involved in cell wall biosynthesis
MLYIIISNYNSEKTISGTLDSLIDAIRELKANSSHQARCKIIVVDDCSTDGSLDIVKNYKGHYPELIQIVRNWRNRGAGWSRRIGLRYVKKNKDNWVSFIDSDDTVKPDYYVQHFKYTDNPEIDIISGSITLYNPKASKEEDIYKAWTVQDRYVTENLNEEMFKDEIYFCNNKLFRANLFRKVKYSKSRFIEDVPTEVKLCLNARALQIINNQGYVYYQRPDSLIHNSDEVKRNIYNTLARIDCYKYFTRHFKGQEIPKQFNLKSIVLNLTLLKANKVDMDEVRKQYPKELKAIEKFINKKLKEHKKKLKEQETKDKSVTDASIIS